MTEPPSQKEEEREKILGGIKEDPSKIFKVRLNGINIDIVIYIYIYINGFIKIYWL